MGWLENLLAINAENMRRASLPERETRERDRSLRGKARVKARKEARRGRA